MNCVAPSYAHLETPLRQSRVVVNVPHAGERIPPEVAPTIALPPEVLRRDVDLGVDRLCARAPALGAALLWTTISRFVADLNRHPRDYAAALERCDGARPPVSYGRRGLVWLETTRGEVVVERSLTHAELQARLRYYRPYHRCLRALLDQRRKAFGSAILVDAHSMPSRGASGHPDSGRERADIVLGDNLGKACEPWLIRPVEAVLEQAGLSVVRNQPYRGGYNTRHYGRPGRGVQALQIEINRKLYMDEATATYDEELARPVREVMDQVIETVVAL